MEWNLQRTIAKINYHIHTDAIKEKIIPFLVTPRQANIIYANEADLLNVALFGQTAKEWRDGNPDKDGNILDGATLEQLVVLSNLESINSVLIHQGIAQDKRLIQLNKIAITQMKSSIANKNFIKLKSANSVITSENFPPPANKQKRLKPKSDNHENEK